MKIKLFSIVYSVLFIHLFLPGQNICDITIKIDSDTISYDDSIICLPLRVLSSVQISSFDLSLTIPVEDVQFQSFRYGNSAFENLSVKNNGSIIILTWQSDEVIQLDANEEIVELCFKIVNFPADGIDLISEGKALPRGNVIMAKEVEQISCTQSGRIETPCSARPFKLDPGSAWRNVEVCRNDAEGLGIWYPFYNHEEIDLPITFFLYRNGQGRDTFVFNSLDRSEAMSPLLDDGKWKYVVTNGLGCSDSTEFEVLRYGDGTTSIGKVRSFWKHDVQHTCEGINEGQISLDNLAKVDSLIWSTGQTSFPDQFEDHKLYDLSPGIYTSEFTQTGWEGCFNKIEVEVENIPTYKVFTHSSPASCDGEDGQAWISFEKEDEYTVEWEGYPEISGPILTKMPPGTYIGTVRNSAGCVVIREIEIGMTEFINLDWETNVSYNDCGEGALATRSISVASANIGPVHFLWSSGEENTGISSVATNLNMGNQWVVATTASCESDTLFFDVPMAEILSVSIDSSQSIFSGCSGLTQIKLDIQSTGSFTIIDQNGQSYDELLSLSVGIYDLTIQNESGCSQDLQVSIENNTPLNGLDFDIQGILQEATCSNDAVAIKIIDHSSEIQEILLDTLPINQSDEIFLHAGLHTIQITNQYGCSWDSTFTISDNSIEITLVDEVVVEQGEEALIEVLFQSTSDVSIHWASLNEVNCNNALCSSINYFTDMDEFLYVEIKNQDGCIAVDSILVNVVREDSSEPIHEGNFFYVPNIVNLESPISNNVCVNLSDAVASIKSFTLYNRWGNIVAGPIENTTDRSTCLLDRNLISTIESGVFVYYIEISLFDGRTIQQAGDITIIR